jgi:peptidoglycan hydrolase CwlO-like protein
LLPLLLLPQVEEGKLSRLHEAASTKASRLESARARLQGLQDKLAAAAAEQKQLTADAAAKAKEAHAAGAEQRRVG